ncbi:MAG: hypothetical protein AABY95_01310 [Pseudomonadota bacterium]
MRLLLVAALLLVCTACEDFRVKDLAKNDISFVADAHIRQMRAQQEALLVKLYKRNPRELAKATGETIESRLASLAPHLSLAFDELDFAKNTDAMLLAFSADYQGDRVFALMAGLVGMIRASYGGREEFFMLQALDEQALYNSARNIEILSWRLRHRQGADGKVYLLTTGADSDTGDLNLSFERIFGKMIVMQDMMASIAAERNKRAINMVVHGVARMVFLPVP